MEVNQIAFVFGLLLATVATISGVIAFALPSWIYTYETDSIYGISHAGLWTYCLDNLYDPVYDYNNGVPMYGCKWIYSEYLKEVRWTILNPVWYIVVQIMATINLILSLLGVGGLYIICCVHKNNCPLIFGIIAMFFCTVLGFCEVVLYALRVTDEEYYKVPNAAYKSLGAGWGMAVVAAIVSGFAMIALIVSYLTVRKERKRLKRESLHSLQQQQATREHMYRQDY